jgi:hypothetical protein
MKTFIFLSSLMSCICFAMDWTSQVDIRNTATDNATCNAFANCSGQSQLLYGVGVTTKIPLANDFSLKTGGLIVQRGTKVSITGFGEGMINAMTLDIPVLAEYSISDSFRVYGGVALGAKIGSPTCVAIPTVGNCNGISQSSLITPLQIGVGYNFSKTWGANFMYEAGTTIGNQTSVGDGKTANVISLGGGYTF